MWKVQRKAGESWVTVMGGFRSEVSAKFWACDQDWFVEGAEYRVVKDSEPSFVGKPLIDIL